MTSPIPTVSIRNGIGIRMPYAYRRTSGTTIVLERIGESVQSTGLFLRRSRVPTAPARVARLPKRMSGRTAPPKILPIRQPIKRPGTAAGVNTGRMVSASATRACTSPNENAEKTQVRTT